MSEGLAPPPPRCPRLVITPFRQRKAVQVALRVPTTSPESLIALAELAWPGVRSVIAPLSQRTAWLVEGGAVVAPPTIWPKALMAEAPLEFPPRVPRSVITPFCQRNAWPPAAPTTWPASLMSAA